MEEQDLNVVQVNEAWYKMIKMNPRTIQYDIRLRSMCNEDHRLMFGTLDVINYEQTHSLCQ